MDSGENAHDAEYDATTEKTYVDSRGNQPRKSRTRLVIIGVVAAVVIIAVVIVVVVVVTQMKKDENKEKNECGPYTLPAGFNFSMLSPRILSRQFTCPLEGDCWTGEKCYQCLKLDKWKVGNINNIPVCCEDCLSRRTMDTREKQPASVYTVSNQNSCTVGKSNTESRCKSPETRRLIARRTTVGLIIFVIIVAVIVPITVSQIIKKNKSSKEKNDCGPFSYPGINISALTPKMISFRKTCPLEGNCWTGEQCYECFKLPTWKVGNINDIPVCCANCELSGLYLSASECRCRHNGG